MQRLTIRSFGPVREATIDLKDILLFIGPQASGKSTISKAIYFFKSLRDDLVRFVSDAEKKQGFQTSIASFAQGTRKKFLRIYGLMKYSPAMYLKYEYSPNVWVEVEIVGEFPEFRFQGEFLTKYQQIIEDTKTFAEKLSRQNLDFLTSSELAAVESEQNDFRRRRTKQINELFGDDRDLIFLPAGRSLVTIMSDRLSTVYLDENDLDELMRIFITRIDNLRPRFAKSLSELIEDGRRSSRKKSHQKFVSLAQTIADQILKGRYEYSKTSGERLYDEGGGYTAINYASSGQQEAVWILLLIFSLILESRKVFLVVEEPEAHLYPVAQKRMVDLIALLANVNSNQIIVTTHSPYILSSFNNLLYAYLLGANKPDEIGQIVDQTTWIDPQRVSAHMVHQGVVSSIVDEESKLLKTAAIDSASDLIMNTFNQLFELDEG